MHRKSSSPIDQKSTRLYLWVADVRRELRHLLDLLLFDPKPRTNLRHEVACLREALAQMEHRAITAERECQRLREVIERRERVLGGP